MHFKPGQQLSRLARSVQLSPHPSQLFPKHTNLVPSVGWTSAHTNPEQHFFNAASLVEHSKPYDEQLAELQRKDI